MTPIIRADTTVNTTVKYSKVLALAFVKQEGVTDAFTTQDIHAFVVPKLTNDSLFGSAIVQLESIESGENHHSGRGDEAFTGILTKVFSNGTNSDAVTVNPSDLDNGIHTYIMTIDGINETVISAIPVVQPTYGIEKEILITPIVYEMYSDLAANVTYESGIYTLTDQQVTVSTDSEYPNRPVFQIFYDNFNNERTVLDKYQQGGFEPYVYVQIGFPSAKVVSMIQLLDAQGFESVKFEIDTTGDGSFSPVSGTYSDYTSEGIWAYSNTRAHCMFIFDEPLENVYQLKMHIKKNVHHAIVIANAILYGTMNNSLTYLNTAYEKLITPIGYEINSDLATGVTYENGIYTLTDQQVTVSTDSQISNRPVFQIFYDNFDTTRTVLDRYNTYATSVYVQIGFPSAKVVSMIQIVGAEGFGTVKFEIDTVGDGSFSPVSGTYSDYTSEGVWSYTNYNAHCVFIFDEPLENVYKLKMHINKNIHTNIVIANAILYGKHF